MGDWAKSIFVASLALVIILMAPFIIAFFLFALAFTLAVVFIWFVIQIIKEERKELRREKDEFEE